MNNILWPLHKFTYKNKAMAEIIPGYTFEQAVTIVSADTDDINNEIAAQAGIGWILSLITVMGTDVILLFQRNIPAS